MDASAYIGRVGSLAVALGVGAAVAIGSPATAFADTGGETSPQTSSEDSAESTAEQDDSGSTRTAIDVATARMPRAANLRIWRRNLNNDGDQSVAREPVVEESVEKKLVKELVKELVVDAEGDAEGLDEKGAEGTASGAELPAVDPTPLQRKARNRTDKALRSQKWSEPEKAESLSETVGVDRTVVDAAAQKATEQPAAAARTVLVDNVEEVVQSVVPQATATITAITTPTVTRHPAPVINRLLAAFGLGSLRNVPSLPSPAWALSALMALGSRRELDQALATRSVSTSAPTVSLAATAPYDPAKDYKVTPVTVSGNTVRITNVTGPGGLNNTTTRFGIGGTDLGIMWDNGVRDNPTTAVNEHQVLIAFGDTFSNPTPVRTGGWRMNTLFRSTDTVLSNGMYIPDGIPHDPGMYSGSPMTDPNFSREIIGNYHYGTGSEVTMIPTAAISVPGAGKDGATRQYINYMAVRSWDTPGQWTTNYSAIAYSDDNGQNWTVVPQSSVRPAAAGRTITTLPFVEGDQNFQQGAYVRKYTVDPLTGKPLKNAAGQEITDGHIYSYGTPAGRAGTAYLSRAAEADILDKTKYEYWNGTSWTPGNPAAAKPILPPSTTTSFFGRVKTTTYPTVSEMSVQYNSYEKKYVMLYGDKNNNIVMRKANSPEGPWSAPITLVAASKMPGLYAPMIHPWSSTDNVSAEDQKYLYWNLSTWDDYQVKLMRTDLTKV